MQRYVLYFFIILIIAAIFYTALPVIMPFFISFIFAYFLSPKIDFLETKCKIRRSIASVIVVLIFCAGISFAISFIIPEIVSQVSLLVDLLPKFEHYFRAELLPHITSKLSKIDSRFASAFGNAMQSVSSNIVTYIGAIFNNLVGYTLSTLGIFFGMFLLPVIVFYLLLDWHSIFKALHSIVPLKHQESFENLCNDINNVVYGYIRWQFYICIGVSIYYSISFFYIGLYAPIILGLICGFGIVVPLIGPITSLTLALIDCYFSLGFGVNLLYIIALFLVSQIIEGSIVTPKVIGNKIGIHPVMIIFSVLFLGNLFGLIGILFAIPISAIVNVLFSHMIRAYRDSSFFKEIK